MGTAPTAFDGTGESSVAYTEANFTAMQNAGIVILPAAGYKQNDSWLNVGKIGGYWTDQANTSTNAYRQQIASNTVNLRGTISKTTLMFSVRLANESANSGKLAGRFTVSSNGGTFSAQDKTSATFVMPDANAVISATYTRKTVTLTDGEDITGLSLFTGKLCDVTYSRSFSNGKTSTVCLPFAYTKKEGDGSFYEFTNIEEEGGEYVATMTEPGESTLTANTPYLYKPNADGNVDFSGTYEIPASLTAGSTTSNGWTFKGTYETIQWTEAPTGIYGFSAQNVDDQGISQGQFVKVGAYVRVKPMRCYLENEDWTGALGMNRAAEQLPETIKVRLVSANGEVMGIGTLQTKTGEVTLDNEAWYSLDGRRIVSKPNAKGIYVNKGKKVIIK